MTNATYGTDLKSLLQSSCGMGLMVYLGFPRTFGPGSPQATGIRGSAPPCPGYREVFGVLTFFDSMKSFSDFESGFSDFPLSETCRILSPVRLPLPE